VHGRRQARILGARRALSPGELADPSFDLKAYRREVPLPAYGGRRRRARLCSQLRLRAVAAELPDRLVEQARGPRREGPVLRPDPQQRGRGLRAGRGADGDPET
jgi:hypothetical protein